MHQITNPPTETPAELGRRLAHIDHKALVTILVCLADEMDLESRQNQLTIEAKGSCSDAVIGLHGVVAAIVRMHLCESQQVT